MRNPVEKLAGMTRSLLRPITHVPQIKRSRIGAPPGSLEYTGVERSEEVSLTLIDWKDDHFEEITGIDSSWKERVPSAEFNSWLDVSGVHDVSIIEEIGQHLDIHPLIMEDIIHPNQRPKFEPFDDQL